MGMGEVIGVVEEIGNIDNATTITNCTGQYHVPPTREALDAMGVMSLLLWMACWYCSHVSSGGHTAPKPLHFFLLPSFWRGRDTRHLFLAGAAPDGGNGQTSLDGASNSGGDPDVLAAERLAWKLQPQEGGGLLLRGLRKEFNGKSTLEALLLPLLPNDSWRRSCSVRLRRLHLSCLGVGLPSIERPAQRSVTRALVQSGLLLFVVLGLSLIISGTQLQSPWLWRIGIGEGRRTPKAVIVLI
jgi:hypothetical protein